MYECRKQGAISIIEPTESLTSEQIDQAEAVLQKTMESGQPKIVLSFKNITLVDSAGLEWLLDSLDACLQCGGNLKLSSPNPLCEDIFRITGILSKFEVYPDTLSAVGSYTA